MSDHPRNPAPPQPMGAENDRVKFPDPDQTQLPPGEKDTAAPVAPAPDPDA